MTEENWIDWPNGATLESLPVGARVAYPKARYERTGQGLHCYWSDSIGAVKGRDCPIDDGWVAPQKVALPSGYRFEGSEVVKEEAKPSYCHNRHGAYTQLCDESCREVHGGIESPLARAVREQMSQAYTAQAYQQQIYAQQGGLGLSDYVFRQGDYQQTGIQYGDCPRPECARKSWNPMRDRCDHCGVTGKEIAAKRAKPACKCGATENVRDVTPAIRHKLADLTGKGVRHDYLCGPCYQTQRRAELQAQKLEQTKRDMNRPVKRDPYEWLGFSSADWEE